MVEGSSGAAQHVLLGDVQRYLMEYQNGLEIYFQYSNPSAHVAIGQCAVMA